MRKNHRGLRILIRVITALFIAGVVGYLAVLGMMIWKKDHLPPMGDYEAIVILGAQVKPDGTPNLQLQWRLDGGLAAWRERPCPIVVCGAQGDDEPRAEGVVMREYLLARGVPDNLIYVDDKSFNTRENLQHAAALLDGTGIQRVLIVTSDYHLPRALSIAEDLGYTATGSPTATLGGWHRVKNYARETVAWIKYGAEKLFGIEIHNANFRVNSIERTERTP
ncbi:MAG: YdcF family protein [Clostridia bacterium]|nr:YdcF family protein [Clostridia bacterium]